MCIYALPLLTARLSRFGSAHREEGEGESPRLPVLPLKRRGGGGAEERAWRSLEKHACSPSHPPSIPSHTLGYRQQQQQQLQQLCHPRCNHVARPWLGFHPGSCSSS